MTEKAKNTNVKQTTVDSSTVMVTTVGITADVAVPDSHSTALSHAEFSVAFSGVTI